MDNLDKKLNALIPWLRLSLEPGVGLKTAHQLIATFSNADTVFKQSYQILATIIKPRLAEQICAPTTPEIKHQITQILHWLATDPSHYIIHLKDPLYPASLKQIHDPPLLLYVKGSIHSLNKPCIAIAGARRASSAGKDLSYRFAAELSKHGFCIVSGLAQGIDAAAHEGALSTDQECVTIAVLGTGIDQTYPTQHINLSQRIQAQGTLISEFPVGEQAKKHHFPLRNRIIAGLSKGVIIIEAASKSGSLITAQVAIENHRDIFAVPGPVQSALSKGAHQLIKEGAFLTEDIHDVLAAYPSIKYQAPSTTETPKPLSPEAQSLLELIPFSPITLDDLLSQSAITYHNLLELLFNFELQDLIERLDSGLYQRRR